MGTGASETEVCRGLPAQQPEASYGRGNSIGTQLHHGVFIAEWFIFPDTRMSLSRGVPASHYRLNGDTSSSVKLPFRRFLGQK